MSHRSGARPGEGTAELGKRRSYVGMVTQRYVRNRAAVVGMLILTVFLLTVIFAPYIAPYDPAAIDLTNRLSAPSPQHWLGTDELGRDVFSRIIVGGRITLVITMGAVALALIFGTILGLLAGYYGGYADTIISRGIDILMAVPGFLLAIGIVAALGVGTTNVIIAVGVASIPAFARIARSSTFSEKVKDYILAARALGAGDRYIVRRHVLVNIVPPLIVQSTLRLATAMLSAASLSFLGLGPQPPIPEWGAMLSTGRNYFTSGPLLVIFPGLAILLVSLSFNLMGDGLRDALDPRLNQ